jgi:FkbM family methyltransferase
MTPLPKSVNYKECQLILGEIRSKSANYSWLWTSCGRRNRLLPWREKKKNDGPWYITFEELRHRVDPERPYFFGVHSNGIRFAGDARDVPSAIHAIYPAANSTLINALIAATGRKNGEIIDIGSNIGIVSASLCRHIGTQGRVHAFEPSPSTFNLTAATLALNNLTNFTLTQTAIGDVDGDITFYATPGNSAISSTRRHDFAFLNTWEKITVPSRKLDTIVSANAFRDVNLIKIDVEGHEMSVLRGARTTIERFRPTVVYEYTPVAAPTAGWSALQSITQLESVGSFKFEAIVEPSLEALNQPERRISFPLPGGVMDQVNVFAYPV